MVVDGPWKHKRNKIWGDLVKMKTPSKEREKVYILI